MFRAGVRGLQLWACAVASNASGARRRQGTDLGVFAVAVCVLMVTGAFGLAENLPVAVREATAKSVSCGRAWFAIVGV
eukprot:COSAG02_NODE_57722_length_279_cov_1.450000_1_plen_77_part_01